MVVRANQAYGELGGHIASYASAADLFEVGFNHFFRASGHAANGSPGGDLVFYQPHSAPGVYARAFLEGRLHGRRPRALPAGTRCARSTGARGLSSYPHPWLMPDFWQFPTGSMGLGPISSIYHARFLRYLEHRRLARGHVGSDGDSGQVSDGGRRVWGVFGDGEMDEPESMSALTLAAREKLDNLIWVVNCNLQRLDGPVRGNGRIIDELEGLFAGAGWRVIKLVWGSDWDGLFARDREGALAKIFAEHRRRSTADLRREGRPLQPRSLLRTERRVEGARRRNDRRSDRSAHAWRPRPREDPCGLSRGGAFGR